MYLYVPKMACKRNNRVSDLRYKNGEDSHCMTLFFFKSVSMFLISEIYLETNGYVHKGFGQNWTRG